MSTTWNNKFSSDIQELLEESNSLMDTLNGLFISTDRQIKNKLLLEMRTGDEMLLQFAKSHSSEASTV